MANQRRARRPAVIEEEPPHEFYASLCGKPATALTGASRKKEDRPLPLPAAPIAVPSFPPHDSRLSVPRHVVPPDEDEDPRDGSSVKGESDFSRTYMRALSGPETKMTSLALDGSNRGYRLLSRMGWKEEGGGLGRNRQGSMLPIKTRFKSDKKGLGRGKKLEARITHRRQVQQGAAIGTAAAKREATVETKAARRLRAREEADRERRRDKRARMLLRTDVSDEYEELYLRLQR